MKGNPQGFEERVACGFLAVHAGHFRDPTNPPLTVLLDD
jgi:hypothetical protein